MTITFKPMSEYRMAKPRSAASIILFDGVCNLCNYAVIFTIRRDPQGKMCFASQQSEIGQELLVKFGLPQDTINSIVFIEGDRCFLRSSAVLHLVRRLNGFWPLFYVFIIIPKPIRDFLYNYIASHRYQWFGRKDVCMIPTIEMKSRFLD
mgnify:CR=1 FL=1